MNKLLILSLSLMSFNASAKLLDKIAGVINDKVFTLSEVKRVKGTLGIRKEIAPFIYTKKNYNQQEVLKVLQNSFIIRDKLSELGFVISDDSVEDRVNQTQKGLGLNRDELLLFLKSKGITYNEYFEILREAMEYNIFNRRIIAPLVTITDQELKNYYYKLNSSNKALSFKYKVVDFVLPEKKVLKKDIKKLPTVLEKYQKTGNIPAIYNSISTNDLGNVADDDLPGELSKLLKKTDEKSFSKPYIKDGMIHIFYVVTKDLAESSDFLKKKGFIYNKLFLERAQSLSDNWFSRESLNYYILQHI